MSNITIHPYGIGGALPAPSLSDRMVNAIPDYIVEGAEVIDTAAMTAYAGTIQKGGTWFTTTGKHKTLAVTEGEKYVISGDGNGFWAWLSSSYSPPVTNNTPVPFASGYTNRILQKDAVAVTVPAGAAYLVFTTVNGAGTTSAWEIWKVNSYKRRTVGASKFRLAQWNIGGFLYTDWSVGDPTHTISSADAATYAQRYRELLNGVNPDIIGVAEYNDKFSDANWNTKDVLFQCYTNAYEGAKSGVNCNSIFGNIMEWVGAEEVDFTTRQENRYYTHITARFRGENIHLVEAHLDHTYNAKREAQIAQLVADMSPYKYVAIAGDLNTGDEDTIEAELAAFTDAGYKLANGGYLGLLVTSLTGEYVDNIVVKGLNPSGIEVVSDSGTLSDHLLICCDLTLDV